MGGVFIIGMPYLGSLAFGMVYTYIPPNGIIKICNFENPLNLEATDEDIYRQATICRKEVRGNVFVSSKAAYTPVNQND